MQEIPGPQPENERKSAFPVSGAVTNIVKLIEWITDKKYREIIFKRLESSNNSRVKVMLDKGESQTDISLKLDSGTAQLKRVNDLLNEGSTKDFTPIRITQRFSGREPDNRHALLDVVLSKVPTTSLTLTLTELLPLLNNKENASEFVPKIVQALTQLEKFFKMVGSIYGPDAFLNWHAPLPEDGGIQAIDGTLRRELLSKEMYEVIGNIALNSQNRNISEAASKCLREIQFSAPEKLSAQFNRSYARVIGSSLPTMTPQTRSVFEAMVIKEVRMNNDTLREAIPAFFDKIIELLLETPGDELNGLALAMPRYKYDSKYFLNAINTAAQKKDLQGHQVSIDKIDEIVDLLKKQVTVSPDETALRVRLNEKPPELESIEFRVELIRDLIIYFLANPDGTQTIDGNLAKSAAKALRLLTQLSIEHVQKEFVDRTAIQAAQSLVAACKYETSPSPLDEMRPEHLVWIYEKIDNLSDSFLAQRLILALFNSENTTTIRSVVDSGFNAVKLAKYLNQDQVLFQTGLDMLVESRDMAQLFPNLLPLLPLDSLHDWLEAKKNDPRKYEASRSFIGEELFYKTKEVPNKREAVQQQLLGAIHALEALIRNKPWNQPGNLTNAQQQVASAYIAVKDAYGNLSPHR